MWAGLRLGAGALHAGPLHGIGCPGASTLVFRTLAVAGFMRTYVVARSVCLQIRGLTALQRIHVALYKHAGNELTFKLLPILEAGAAPGTRG